MIYLLPQVERGWSMKPVLSLSSPPPTHGGEEEEEQEEEDEEEEEVEEEEEDEEVVEMSTDEYDEVSELDDNNGEGLRNRRVLQFNAQGQGLVSNHFTHEFQAAKEEYRKCVANEGTAIFVPVSDFFVPCEGNIMHGGNAGEGQGLAQGRGPRLAQGRGLAHVSAGGQGLDEQRLHHLHAARALELRALEALER